MSNSKKLKALADLTLSQTDLLQLLTIKIDVLEHLFLKHLLCAYYQDYYMQPDIVKNNKLLVQEASLKSIFATYLNTYLGYKVES